MKLYLPRELKNTALEFSENLIDALKETNIIKIPEKTIFRGKEIELSYEEVVGENLQGISYPTLTVDNQTQFKFTNAFEELQANKKTIAEIAKILHIDPKFTFEKYLMVNGGTLPVKVILQGKNENNTKFVKKADNIRLLGNALYNIAMNSYHREIHFNSHMIIESELKGMLASRINEELMLTNPTYRRGLGKLAAISDYLGFAPDIVAPKNRLITENKETEVFDFDGVLSNNTYQQGSNPIITYFANFKGKERLDKEFMEGFIEGMKTIANNLEAELPLIEKISNESGTLQTTSLKEINFQLHQLYGESNILSYTQEKIRQYKNI